MIKIYQCWTGVGANIKFKILIEHGGVTYYSSEYTRTTSTITFGCCDGEKATGHGGFWLTKKSAEHDLKQKLKNLSDCIVIKKGIAVLKVYK